MSSAAAFTRKMMSRLLSAIRHLPPQSTKTSRIHRKISTHKRTAIAAMKISELRDGHSIMGTPLHSPHCCCRLSRPTPSDKRKCRLALAPPRETEGFHRRYRHNWQQRVQAPTNGSFLLWGCDWCTRLLTGSRWQLTATFRRLRLW